MEICSFVLRNNLKISILWNVLIISWQSIWLDLYFTEKDVTPFEDFFLIDNICIWKYAHICKKIEVLSQIANLKLVIRLFWETKDSTSYNKEAHGFNSLKIILWKTGGAKVETWVKRHYTCKKGRLWLSNNVLLVKAFDTTCSVLCMSSTRSSNLGVYLSKHRLTC